MIMLNKRQERKKEKRDLYKKLSEKGFGLQQALSGLLAKHLRSWDNLTACGWDSVKNRRRKERKTIQIDLFADKNKCYVCVCTYI